MAGKRQQSIPLLSIIIVNYNVRDFLHHALLSLQKAMKGIRGEIIDWTIPSTVDPATGDTLALGSDDVILQNNNAQKNVFDFEAAT